MFFDRFDLGQAEFVRGGKTAPDEVACVIREVTRLLNCRSPLSATECAAASRRTVLDYGLADFLHLSPLARQDAQVLAGVIHSAITAHVPRLLQPDVSVETPRPSREAVRVNITGRVAETDGSTSTVRFAVSVTGSLAAAH